LRLGLDASVANDPERTSVLRHSPYCGGPNLITFENWRRPKPQRGGYVRRRDFIKLIACSAVAWPLAAHAQQSSAPTVGFLISASAAGYGLVMGPILKGLEEAGYVEGKNLAIEYRWADYHYDRLPTLAAELVDRKVAVIFTTGSIMSALAAKSATSAIPIVFANGSDPVKYGLVSSLNRPGGNVTGVTFSNSSLGPKRIELLRQIVPKVVTIGLLVNPNNPISEDDGKEIKDAGQNVGIHIEIISASSEGDIDKAFAKIAQMHPDALMVHIDALFNAHIKKLIALAERYAVPTMFASHEGPKFGGLISYGTNVDEMDRQAGMYIGKILKGARPSELPVLQPTKFELIINLKTAKALGLTVPLIMQMTADEVIE
jgi:putative ABC transport system substrate-binding protein